MKMAFEQQSVICISLFRIKKRIVYKGPDYGIYGQWIVYENNIPKYEYQAAENYGCIDGNEIVALSKKWNIDIGECIEIVCEVNDRNNFTVDPKPCGCSFAHYRTSKNPEMVLFELEEFPMTLLLHNLNELQQRELEIKLHRAKMISEEMRNENIIVKSIKGLFDVIWR